MDSKGEGRRLIFPVMEAAKSMPYRPACPLGLLSPSPLSPPYLLHGFSLPFLPIQTLNFFFIGLKLRLNTLRSMNRYCWDPGFYTAFSFACVPTGDAVKNAFFVR
jgi:hypothetical protein